MNWREVTERTASYLDAHGVPDGAVAAELLAARLLKCTRGALASHFGGEVREAHLAALRRAMKRLAGNEPIQYVLGEWDFRSLTLKCDARALIPRPETEELVTRVLAWLDRRRDSFSHPPVIVDVGTGTGAIALSIASEYRGEAVIVGTDVSEGAIALARENAALTGLADRVQFAVADGLDDFDEPESVDAIVSNPPYVASAVCETLDVRIRDFEPRLALDGGASGLDFYDRYLADALNVLRPGGAVFFEIGDDQGAAVSGKMLDCGFTGIRVERDFSGHDRYALGELPA